MEPSETTFLSIYEYTKNIQGETKIVCMYFFVEKYENNEILYLFLCIPYSRATTSDILSSYEYKKNIQGETKHY